MDISNHCEIYLDDYRYVYLGEYDKIGYKTIITAKDNSQIKMIDKVQVGRAGEIHACNLGKINIGTETTFSCYLYMCSEKSLVEIREQCMFSYYVKLNVGSHRLINKNEGIDVTNRKSIIIGKHVWCGMGVTIMPWCQIGDESVVGASSLVNNEIPSNCTCAGNLAKVLRKNIEWFRK